MAITRSPWVCMPVFQQLVRTTVAYLCGCVCAYNGRWQAFVCVCVCVVMPSAHECWLTPSGPRLSSPAFVRPMM